MNQRSGAAAAVETGHADQTDAGEDERCAPRVQVRLKNA
jgi:hypothetical protein